MIFGFRVLNQEACFSVVICEVNLNELLHIFQVGVVLEEHHEITTGQCNSERVGDFKN